MRTLLLGVLMFLGGAGAMAQELLPDLHIWRPNSHVYTISVDSAANVAYIGGIFTTLTDPDPPFTTVTRNYAAAIDLATGELLPWDPNPNSHVHCIAQSATSVYLGGSFNEAGGQPRMALAAVDKTSGLAQAWNPLLATGAVLSMTTASGKLFIGGGFLSVNGTSRQYAAAFDLNTGNLTAWNPSPSDYVLVMQAVGNTMYMGGYFQTLAGIWPTPFLAGVDMNSGTMLSNVPAPNAPVRAMTTANGRLYIGGGFTEVGGVPRTYAAALLNGGLTAWDPAPDAAVSALAKVGTEIAMGGGFLTVGGQAYNSRLVVVNANTGAANAWNSGVGHSVTALATRGGRILCGGVFTSVMQFSVHNFTSFTPAPALVRVQPRVFLEGCYVSAQQSMNDALRAASLVPQTEPYSAMGYTFTAGGAQGTITSSVMASATNPVVDWVVVELRDPLDPAAIVASKRGVLLRSGYVMDVNKTSPLWIPAPPGNYHVAIKHRNHLGAMSAAPLALSATSSIVDFTASNFVAYGTNAMRTIGSKQVLWAGDARWDGVVRYTGTDNDRDQVLQAIGGSVPTNVLSNVYDARDVNLDGAIMYVGANNDRDLILQTIGGTVPTAARTQQLP